MLAIRTLLAAAVIAAAATSICVSPPAEAAAKRPAVAEKLAEKNLKVVGAVRCARIAGRWQPGRVLPKGWFIAHERQARNATTQARRAKGAKRRRLLRDAARYTRLARAQRSACVRTPTVPGTAPAPGAPAAAAKVPLRFDLSGAAGVALADGGTTRSQGMTLRQASGATTLQVVTAAGSVRPAVTSGSAPVSRFLVAPNDKLYVVFSTRVDLEDTSRSTQNGCLIAEVDRASSTPVCIDATLTHSAALLGGMTRNPTIQLDGAGAIYYSGSTADGKTVLRRHLTGATTDLISDNVALDDFLVLQDGSVIITGETRSTGAQWTRRVTPQGGLQTLRATKATYIRRFPDGNVYFGTWGSEQFGVRRFMTQSGQVDPRPWISRGSAQGEPYFDSATFCGPDDMPSRQAFCGADGTWNKALFATGDGQVYGIAGSGGQRGGLVRYFPDVSFPQTLVKNISTGQAVMTNLVLAGVDAEGRNVMTIYNTTNGSERQILGSDNDIEVYHVNYSAAANKVLFDGLRFADNKYVLGQVDLETGQITVSATLAARWTDFQTFGG